MSPRLRTFVPTALLLATPALAEIPAGAASAGAAPATRTMTLAAPFAGEKLAPETLRGATGKVAWSVDLVRLPAGTFTMGALEGEGGDPKAVPAHEETVASFWMADVETPWGLFQRFCDPAEKAAWPSPDWSCPTAGDPKAERADLPVVNVSWWDAVYFCNWLTAGELGAAEQVYVFAGEGDARTVEIHPERRGYRLPTEAEWEWAARAGNATNRYSGYAHPSWGCDYANLKADGCVRGTADVFDGVAPARPPASGKGAFKPNAWGLYQVTGNVQEWVNDARPGAKGEPDRLRTYRGGSWDLAKLVVNVSDPALKRTLEAGWVVFGGADLPSRRRIDHGFRIARSG